MTDIIQQAEADIESLWQKIETALQPEVAQVEAFVSLVGTDIQQFVATVVPDAINAVLPYAKQLLPLVLADAAALFTGAGWGAVIGTLIPQVEAAAAAAGGAAAAASKADLATAVHIVVTQAQQAFIAANNTPIAGTTSP